MYCSIAATAVLNMPIKTVDLLYPVRLRDYTSVVLVMQRIRFEHWIGSRFACIAGLAAEATLIRQLSGAVHRSS